MVKSIWRAFSTATGLCLFAAAFPAAAQSQSKPSFDKEIPFEEMTSAEKTAAKRAAKRRHYPQLTFCADPGNMPLSSNRREGLQNKIAEAVAKKMGSRVVYFWRPYLERGLTRETFDNRECEILIEVPYGYQRVLTTIPIYRSTYVFATRRDSGIEIESFDDPDLRTKRVGVFQHSGMREALARHGIKDGLALHIISHDADLNPENQPWRQVQAVLDGELDIAAVWGPFAGWLVARGEPLALTPANLMEDEVILEFDLAFGVRSNDAVLKYAMDFALKAAEPEIQEILESFGVPLVACSNCVVNGDLPSHGTFFSRFKDIPQDRFTKVKPDEKRMIDLDRASEDQVMNLAKLSQALQDGADVEAEFANAVLASDESRVTFLLERGASIDKRDLQGAPPLVTAAKSRDTQMMAFLLDRGADITVTDRGGWNALHHAVLRNHVPSIELLAARGADLAALAPGRLPPLALAIGEGMRWAAKALIEAGASVDQAFAEDGLTPLMVLTTQSETFNRDLRVAGGPSVLEIAELLISAGADVNATTRHGVTPLMTAAGHDNAAMIGLLIKAGADPSRLNKAGQTALDIARLGRNEHAAKSLKVFALGN